MTWLMGAPEPIPLYRMFARRMGMPPHRYISEMRLEHAKSLLALGLVPLAGGAVLISAPLHFRRAAEKTVPVH